MSQLDSTPTTCESVYSSQFRQDVFEFVIEGVGSDSQLMQEQAAVNGMNEEQTASLKTALLH